MKIIIPGGSGHADTSMRRDFETNGFSIIPAAIPVETLEALTRSVESLSASPEPGSRNLAEICPPVAQFSESPEIAALLESLGAAGAFLVRSIFFDKQPGANWKVPWHQDLTIAVRERKEIAGFGPWSIKGGGSHVQPPAKVLEKMVTLRLHLDDCDASNGALKVLPGSHKDGALNPGLIQRWRLDSSEVVCSVAKGSILAMRPLLLHASSKAIRPTHRRVIHLEFAMDDLPSGLEWNWSRRHIAG